MELVIKVRVDHKEIQDLKETQVLKERLDLKVLDQLDHKEIQDHKVRLVHKVGDQLDLKEIQVQLVCKEIQVLKVLLEYL